MQPLPPDDPPPEPPRKKGGALAPVAAGIGVLLLKMKGSLALLKAVPLGKLLLTSLSMAAMVLIEAQRYGVLYGVGFVLLILVHELGHGYAIRRAGLQAGWPVFIPFFGAMIALRGRPPTAAVEAEIAYAGPLAGTAASLACAALYLLTGSRLLLVLGYTGFFLNLFNLIPMSPLDGGRVAQAFSRRAWVVGGVLLGAMFFVTQAPQLVLIGGVALLRGLGRQASADQTPATEEEKRAWMVRYFGLCFFLGAAIYLTKRLLAPAA